MHRSRLRYLAVVGLLVLIGFFVRASSLDAQSLWRDEVDALRFATGPWSEMLSNFTRPGWNGPLYYLLLRGWIAASGTTEYALRFLSLLFGVLCIPLTYLVGCHLFSPLVGLLSALLVTTSPYLSWYSQEVKMYTLVLALALLAVYALHRALEDGSWHWWLVQIVATSTAFYSHILAALLVPVQVLLALAYWPQLRRRWRGALISLACLTLPYLPLAIWQAPLALRTRDTGFFPYSLKQMVVILLNGWSAGIRGWGDTWTGALMGLLALIGLTNVGAPLHPETRHEEHSTQGESLRHRAGLFFWLSVPLLCVWLISLRQPLFTDRYLIWSAPAFYLLVAVALSSFALPRHWTRWAVLPLMGALLVSNGVNLWQQATIPVKSDFRAAAAYVARHYPSTAGEPVTSAQEFEHRVYLPATATGTGDAGQLIVFQIPHGKYTFDYYFPIQSYHRVDGLYTNHQTATGEYVMSEEQAARQMEAMTTGYKTAWLVATEVSMWDERNLVQQWLDQHGRRVAEAHFNRVDVYQYELPDA